MNLETPPNAQQEFLNYSKEIMGSYIKEKIENAKDTDSIFGKISGEIDTTPTTYFDISFDSNKENLEFVVEGLLEEKISTMSLDYSSKFKVLNAEVFTAPESEKDKPAEEREGSGGYRALI